jgi:hypothetical protein
VLGAWINAGTLKVVAGVAGHDVVAGPADEDVVAAAAAQVVLAGRDSSCQCPSSGSGACRVGIIVADSYCE